MMRSTIARLCLAVGFVAVAPATSAADRKVDLRLHRTGDAKPQRDPAADTRARPLHHPANRTGPVARGRAASGMQRLTKRPRDRVVTCADTGFRCGGSGTDWTGNVTLGDLDARRQLVATGWGMTLNDGNSTSERILTVAVREPLWRRAWVQVGAGYAQHRLTFAKLGQYGSQSQMVPAASFGLGMSVQRTENVETNFGVTAATAISELDLIEDLDFDFHRPSIYNLSVGVTGTWR